MRLKPKERMMAILERAAQLRKRRPLHYDACDMIYCALLDEADDNLANAEFELQMKVPSGDNNDEHWPIRFYLHQDLADLREDYFLRMKAAQFRR